MKTFETPKVVELGTLQQIVLSSPAVFDRQDAATAAHTTSGALGS